jgi:NAD(P)-dependent dehydrogenase (short-subunit alcohol dehydrogenase family)
MNEWERFMSNQVVLITGALTGIGRATSIAFAKARANIVISGRHADEGQKLAAELRSLGAKAEFVQADVRRESDVQKLVDHTMSRFGRLDAAVNNAGTEGKPGPLTEQTAESYAATFDTNVLGTLLSIKHELRAMLPQGHGSIINVSSTYGRSGAPGAALYVGSKHAVEGFTKAAALEFAETGIRINVVAPGPIETGMLNRFTGTPENKADLISRVPMKRIGQPEEVAEAILFLASDKASYITGASLATDGGKLAR